MPECKLLIVDDDTDVLLAAEIVLKKHYSQIKTESDPQQLPLLLQHECFDVVLLDMNFTAGKTSGQEGLDWLRTIHSIAPDTKVILMTAYGQVDTAVSAIKEGAADFVVKPWENERLIATVGSAIRFSQAARTVKKLSSVQKALHRDLNHSSSEIIGQSDAMADIMSRIERVADTDASVLILGENGTGKELIARAIHRASSRAEAAFVHVDLGAIAETLFESELFGHKKGAFTDAREDRPGRFEVASGGTLFLDEIGNLSLQMQSKLLGALQSRTVSRVGSDTPIPVDARIIAATNVSRPELTNGSDFRQDLLYRINTVEIEIPALRNRTDDIEALLDHYVERFSGKYNKPAVRIHKRTLRELEKYPWPGNIRELVHAVERAVIMSDGDQLALDELLVTQPAPAELTAPEDLNLDKLEARAIGQAIAKHKGNLSQAARELGLGRTTLYRKMQKHGI